MARSREEVGYHRYNHEYTNPSFGVKVVLALAVLGVASAAISGYTIFERDRYSATATATSTNTPGRKTLTPVITPTPMYPSPPDVYQPCRNITPDQIYIYVRPDHEGNPIVTGDKNILYLVGKPNRGKWVVLFPGGYFPPDFDTQTDQFVRCEKLRVIPVPASPTR